MSHFRSPFRLGADRGRRHVARWPVLLCVLAALAVVTSCGDSSSDDQAAADTSSDSAESANNGEDEGDGEVTGDDEAESTDESDDDSDSDSETELETEADGESDGTTEVVELTDSYQGVTAAEIQFGIASIDAEALEPFGVNLAVVPVEDMYVAWSEALNERGGVLGRDLVPHSRLFLPIGNAGPDELCLEFGEDIGVFAVIGQFIDGTMACVTEGQGLPYIGHFGLTPDLEERSGGLFFATEMANLDQRTGGVAAMIEQGDLDGQRVALYWENPVDAEFADAVRPLLDDAGIEIVAEVEIGTFGTDQVAAEQAVDVAMERFSASEVDVILNLSGIIAVTEGVDRAGLDIELAFTNGQAADGFIFPEAEASDAVKARSFAITTSKPSLADALADPEVLRCITEYEDRFPDAPLDRESLLDIASVTNHCRAFALMVTGMEAAGVDLTPQSFIGGTEGLGRFDLPAMPNAFLSPESHAAGSQLARYEYDAELGYHVKVGEPFG